MPLQPEDQKILETARQLCDQLDFRRADLQTITWRERLGIRRVPPDFILAVRHNLQLPASLMGKLTPEEWRPVLASGLTYWKQYNREMLKATLPTFLVIPVVLIILVATGEFLERPGLLVLRYFSIGLTFVLLGLALSLTLMGQKKRWFKIDEKATRLVRREDLISSLMKIASIDQSSTITRKGFIRPSIQERIQHLSS